MIKNMRSAFTSRKSTFLITLNGRFESLNQYITDSASKVDQIKAFGHKVHVSGNILDLFLAALVLDFVQPY